MSAGRELLLEPAFGPDGLWTRLGGLSIPAAFVWGERDVLVPFSNAPHVAEALPGSLQMHVACAGHFENGPHFRCMERGALEGVRRVNAGAGKTGPRRKKVRRPFTIACVANEEAPDTALAAAPEIQQS